MEAANGEPFAQEPAAAPVSSVAARLRRIKRMSTISEIVESIDARLRYLGDEITTLETARHALDATSNRRAPQAVRTATSRGVSASAASAHTQDSERTNRQTRSAASHEPARRSRKLAREAGPSRTKRAVNAVTTDALESLLSGNGGLTTTALAERAKIKRDQVLVLLRELEAAGRIRRTGQRRATRWHAITDEDRIRERAAELEATRKRTT